MTDIHSEFAGLLEAMQSLGSRKKPLEARLKAIEENRATTAPAIYERVKSETQASLHTLDQEDHGLVAQARRLVEQITGNQTALEAKLTKLNEELEEVRFRKTLGEYADDEFQRIERESNEAIATVRANFQPLEEMLSFLEPFASKAAPKSSPLLSDISEMEALFGSGSTPAAKADKAASPASHSQPTEVASRDLAKPKTPFPTASATFRPMLIIKAKDRGEDTYDLASGTTTIGRAPENDIILLEESVSRRHARIVVKGPTCTFEDLSSANGSFLNGEKVAPRDPRPLNDNDVVKLGQLMAMFRLHPDEP